MSDTDPSPFPNHLILRFRPLSDDDARSRERNALDRNLCAPITMHNYLLKISEKKHHLHLEQLELLFVSIKSGIWNFFLFQIKKSTHNSIQALVVSLVYSHVSRSEDRSSVRH